MKRTLLILCIGIILGVIGVYIYSTTQQKGNTEPTVELAHIPETVSDVTNDLDTSEIIEKGEIKTETATYGIYAFYPKNGVGSSVVKNAIDSTIATFKTENATVSEEVNEKLVLNIDYEVKSTQKVNTYVVSEYTYLGGAHGFDNTKTYSFDTKGNQIVLDDFFNTNGYLNALGDIVADIAYSKLQHTDYANIDMIKAGTSPLEENFNRFYIQGTSIIFIFPPYALAPYAAGTIEIEVPKATLGTIVTATYW